MPSELEVIAGKINSLKSRSNVESDEIIQYTNDVMADINKQLETSTRDNRDMLLELRLYRLATQLYEVASEAVVPELSHEIFKPSLYWNLKANRIEIEYNPEKDLKQETEKEVK